MVCEKDPFRVPGGARCVLNIGDGVWINGRVWEIASMGDHSGPGLCADPDIVLKDGGLAGSRFGEYRVVICTGIARVMENCKYVRLAKDVTEVRCTIGRIHGDEDETVFGAGELQENPFCTTCCPNSDAVAGVQS